ncbi:MAG: hypothetical protein GX483_08640 [Actinomycetaceae bacterium]|nr:hypothetical protein [Actinomycetaceae bacterium]
MSEFLDATSLAPAALAWTTTLQACSSGPALIPLSATASALVAQAAACPELADDAEWMAVIGETTVIMGPEFMLTMKANGDISAMAGDRMLTIYTTDQGKRYRLVVDTELFAEMTVTPTGEIIDHHNLDAIVERVERHIEKVLAEMPSDPWGEMGPGPDLDLGGVGRSKVPRVKVPRPPREPEVPPVPEVPRALKTPPVPGAPTAPPPAPGVAPDPSAPPVQDTPPVPSAPPPAPSTGMPLTPVAPPPVQSRAPSPDTPPAPDMPAVPSAPPAPDVPPAPRRAPAPSRTPAPSSPPPAPGAAPPVVPPPPADLPAEPPLPTTSPSSQVISPAEPPLPTTQPSSVGLDGLGAGADSWQPTHVVSPGGAVLFRDPNASAVQLAEDTPVQLIKTDEERALVVTDADVSGWVSLNNLIELK